MCKYTKLSECSTLLSMIFTFQEEECVEGADKNPTPEDGRVQAKNQNSTYVGSGSISLFCPGGASITLDWLK